MITQDVGDTLTNDEVIAYAPADVNDNGHTTYLTVYGGIIRDFAGIVGAITPTDVLPKVHPGQANLVRVDIYNCADGYVPQAGDSVKFLLNQTSAGDNVARVVTQVVE